MFSLAVQNDTPERKIVPVEFKPRAYQRDALEAYWKCRDEHRGVMFELFTGAGKTPVAAQVAKRLGGESKRTLFVCNRRVLGIQSLDVLSKFSGYDWELEQAENRADRFGKKPVVALVQTMQGDRLQSWPRNAFDQIIGDEIHRLMGKEYRKVFEHFDQAKILALTATPDGAKGYGDFVTHTAFRMDLLDAIQGAWAVPFRFRYFTADNFDLDSIDWKRTKEGGDFDLGQLDENIAKISGEIRKAAFQLCGDLRTLVRCPGVQSVKTTTDALNEIKPGCARMIYGEMDDREKFENIETHKAGGFQFLVSCMMIGEGYDDKRVQCLLNARPMTKRHDAVQWWGRGARLWEGIGEIENETERRAAIASSPKPECLVIELNAKCKHELVHPITVFGREFDDAVKKAAKKNLASGDGDIQDALKRAIEEVDRRRARAAAAAAAKVSLKETSPDEPPPRLTSSGEHALTPKQEKTFKALGIPYDETTTKAHANKLIGAEWASRKAGDPDCRSHITQPCKCRRCLVGYRHREFLARWVGVKSPWGMRLSTYDNLVREWKLGGRLKLSPETIGRIVSEGKSK